MDDFFESLLESIDYTFELNAPTQQELDTMKLRRRESLRKCSAVYRSKGNHDKIRRRANNRRARMRGLKNDLTDIQWQRTLDYFGGACAVCGKTPDFWTAIAQDHWIPIASPDCPGTTCSNTVPLCHAIKDGSNACNNTKSDQMPLGWLIGKYGKRKGRAIFNRIQSYLDSVKGDSK